MKCIMEFMGVMTGYKNAKIFNKLENKNHEAILKKTSSW